LVQVHLFRKYSAKRQMNLEDAAVTAVNSVLQQADRDVWVGSTVLRHVTAVVYRFGSFVSSEQETAVSVHTVAA